MHASTLLGAIALFGAAHALPTVEAPSPTVAPILLARADPTAPWVSVDDEGRPAKTLTPFMTVGEDGTSYREDAAPHDLTATVYTYTNYGKVTTTTGDPPNPTATNVNNQGAFPRCFNIDGENAPFCAPTQGSTLFEGSTYYVTWDPDFYNQTDSDIPSNTTLEISLRLDFFNRTRKNSEDGKWEKLDDTNRVPAAWGMIPLPIKSSHLKGSSPHNLTITLMTNVKGSADKNESSKMEVNLDGHKFPEPEPTKIPQQRELLIALPTTFGAIIFLVFGVFLWNRKTRRIQLGNIMSRSRHGYTGRKNRRMFHRNKDEGLHLQAREASPVFEYQDHAPPTIPRRDSDLGSLAGSPVTANFQHQDTTGGGNAFRNEMRRQEQERGDDRYR